MQSTALQWQDKLNTPQAQTHDFAMSSFEEIKQADRNFRKILDELFDGEENVNLIECLLEGTTVNAIEWKPVSQISHTYAELVRLEMYGRLKKLPEQHMFPEIDHKTAPPKDQDLSLIHI